MALQLEPRHAEIILQILTAHLPAGGPHLFAFGSRARGTARSNSDLDLLYRGEGLNKRMLSDLREAFEESNLPFKVDLVIWDDLDASFQSRITPELVPFERW